MDLNKDAMVEQAVEGDGDALEQLIKSIQDRVYNLALKMLYQPDDAEDATQEILIKIVTRLDGFRRESSFDTWALAIASNHLRNTRKSISRRRLTFKQCEEMIVEGCSDNSDLAGNQAEQILLLEEMRISCMQGLLQGLDWDHRITYILGETMDISSTEGSLILGITHSAFRKRLSRARERIRRFLTKNCDLFNKNNPCNCTRQALLGIEEGNLDPGRLRYVNPSEENQERLRIKKQMWVLEGLTREAALMRYHAEFDKSATFIEGMRRMLASGDFRDLEDHY